MVHIICFGNLWFGDDGFGIHVYKQLLKLPLTQNVKLYDASILGMGALNCFAGCDKVIVVDAMDCLEKAVGTVQRLTVEDVTSINDSNYTTHTLGLNHLLSMLPIAFEQLPKIIIYAAKIAQLNKFSDQLSQPMTLAVAETVKLIQQELH